MTSQLDVLGIFNGRSVAVEESQRSLDCTLIISVDHLEIPELSMKIKYDSFKDVFGGTPVELRSRLTENEYSHISPFPSVLIVKYETETGHRTLAFSWEGAGIDSMDYCQIMLYRVFAAHRVRSKNNGAPCYGIVGY